MGEDFSNCGALSKLLRFASTREDGSVKNVALDQYLERMVDDQDQIYYLVAESFENAKASPHLEVFRDKGIEVVLLFDRIDEWLMANLAEYEGKRFQDVMRADLKLPGASEEDDAGGHRWRCRARSGDGAAAMCEVRALMEAELARLRGSTRDYATPRPRLRPCRKSRTS